MEREDNKVGGHTGQSEGNVARSLNALGVKF
jgi:hypothetical protein